MVETVTDKINLNRALVEVQEVLVRLSRENYNKIPDDIKLYIEENKDNSYNWEYDDSKRLQEQGLSEYALAILAHINTEYLLNEEQKEYMEQLYVDNDIEEEAVAREKYDPNDIFKKPNQEHFKETTREENSNQQVKMVEYKESIFKKIINWVKSFFKS